MSKLVRLPFVLLVLLLAALAWAVPAAADPLAPTPEECLAIPAPDICPDLGGGEGTGGTDEPGGATGSGGEPGGSAGSGGEPGGDTGAGGGTGGETGSGGETGGAARSGDAGEPAGGTGDTSRAAVELVVPITPPPGICAEFPAFPGCPEAPGNPTPGEPLTCDQLAELLGLPSCPESFTCEDLAELFGLAGCPEGPPTCADLAELFGLEECPEPPASCEDFAALLGLDDCSQIPCLDTSQLPDDAEAGLAPLLDALEQIGVKACPPKPVTGGGNNGGGNPPPTQPGGQETYYENCDDARAKGKAPVYSTDAGYRAGLDSDNDGIGCEETVLVAAPVNNQSAGRLAYTGIDLELWLRAAAVLVSSGTLLLLAGRRRA